MYSCLILACWYNFWHITDGLKGLFGLNLKLWELISLCVRYLWWKRGEVYNTNYSQIQFLRAMSSQVVFVKCTILAQSMICQRWLFKSIVWTYISETHLTESRQYHQLVMENWQSEFLAPYTARMVTALGFFSSSWLTNVDGMKDLWCSNTVWLLSTQMWMEDLWCSSTVRLLSA